MPLIRPAAALRVLKSSTPSASASTRTSTPSILASAPSQSRALSTTGRRAADHAHEDHYDPPSGWLFGVKPGEKPERESWELIYYWGFCGSLALAVVAYAFKPDTS
ncbi:ESSS subunit of NADH:ubiquinone oxidoreductase-domain-containing protein [Xylogone sp. PMI_703]|nr:ESSS subunit of NADH:ubiquinone oxidoreductase-domain-containing protein [Xylogone sp. PMI_703]